MNEKISIQDIIGRLSSQAGITKKLSAEILRALPAIIEEGLQKDGEARMKGLGIFRLKPVKGKKGRNPKTGERVDIPGHNRVVFLPEQSLKEFIGQLDQPFEYTVIEEKVPVETIPVVAEEPPRPATFREPEPEAPLPEYTYTPVVEPSERPTDPLKPESEYVPRRRMHWIIPLMFGIVIILALIFYFRNCQPVEEIRQKAASKEVPGSQSAVPGTETDTTAIQEPETRNPEPGTERDSVAAQEPGIRNPEPGTENPEPIKKVPELNTKPLTLNTTQVGTHLFQMAREAYGNPFLWVLIYRANTDKIKDPDLAVTGENIVIPALEGAARKLTRNDSLAVSEGYGLVYEFYQSKNDPRAEEFRQVMLKYKPD